jgi:hypothetical protein
METFPGCVASNFQSVTESLHLCHRNEDDTLRKRNKLGAWLFDFFTSATGGCECCIGYRFGVIALAVPIAFLIGKYV